MKPTNFLHPDHWNRINVPPRVAERAATRVDVDENGCWISRYAPNGNGYSQIGWQDAGQRHAVSGHRASWVHVNGQVPLGMTLDHLCKQRLCVNPEHLRILPNYENARRNKGTDWPIGSCAYGHDATELVTVRRRNKKGEVTYGRSCRPCMREHERRYRDRKRADRKESA